MKKKLIVAALAAALFCVPGRAFAEKTVEWGMKLALAADLPGKWRNDNFSVTMFSPGIGFSLGAVAQMDLGKDFFFRPEASLFYSGYKYKNLVISDSSGEAVEKDPKLKKYGIQIPLLAGYGFSLSDEIGLEFFTGPQFRYSFAGKIAIKDKTLKEELGDTFDLWGPDGQRRFDCSWKVGVGLPIRENLITLEAAFGLTDLLKTDMSFRENRIALGFTKFF